MNLPAYHNNNAYHVFTQAVLTTAQGDTGLRRSIYKEYSCGQRLTASLPATGAGGNETSAHGPVWFQAYKHHPLTVRGSRGKVRADISPSLAPKLPSLKIKEDAIIGIQQLWQRHSCTTFVPAAFHSSECGKRFTAFSTMFLESYATQSTTG